METDLIRRVSVLILSQNVGLGAPETNRRGMGPRISVSLGSLSLPSFAGDHHQMTARDEVFELRRLETGNTPRLLIATVFGGCHGRSSTPTPPSSTSRAHALTPRAPLRVGIAVVTLPSAAWITFSDCNSSAALRC